MVKIQIDFSLLDGLLSCGLSRAQCSNILNVSEDTLERRIKEKSSLTFRQYRETKLDHTRTKLIQKAIRLALDGNVTMLIFCLKNICGWTDRKEEVVNISNDRLIIAMADKKNNKFK